MSDPVWQLLPLQPMQTVQSAFRTMPDGSQQSCLVTDQAWVAAGNTPTPAPAPAAVIPQSVAMWQAKAALQTTAFTPTSAQISAVPSLSGATNLLAAASALVTAENNEVLTAFWTGTATIQRVSPVLASIGAELGLTPAQIDALFVAANAISL